MSMYTLLRNNPSPTQEEMEHTFEGNLCRCTGYRPILDGYRTFCSDYCPCKERERESGDTDDKTSKLFDATKFAPLDPTQEIIFPPKLKVPISSNVHIMGFNLIFHRLLERLHHCLLQSKVPGCLGIDLFHFKNCFI